MREVGVNTQGLGTTEDTTHPCPQGELGCPTKTSQTVEQLGHREARSSSHPWPVEGLPVASVWEGSPQGPGAHPWDFWESGPQFSHIPHGRLRGQGLVRECEKATGVGRTHGP